MSLLSYPFRSPFSFLRLPDLSAGRDRADNSPQTSVLAFCSQGQGCHRRECLPCRAVSRIAKRYGNQEEGREKKFKGRRLDALTQNLGFFFLENFKRIVYTKGFVMSPRKLFSSHRNSKVDDVQIGQVLNSAKCL